MSYNTCDTFRRSSWTNLFVWMSLSAEWHAGCCEEILEAWLKVDDSLFLGTWTNKQSSILYHDVCDAGLDFVGFFSLRNDMSAIVCGDGIREERG
ncbi:hypothetical protein TNCV_4014831 [Trichonephila clavipes]|uniref:Uncharacterized protein n=1 Tax=Trichonephila clavipes TaxID=2585209 RepID=A0A8X6RIH5_TRICX|nr:hypothetical protein TNCV_4014831 [Trichonephila clavipes]